MKKQGPRVRARDSRGRVIKGLYVRDGRYIAGFQNGNRWEMVTLPATTLTEAKRERESLVSGLREGRIAERDDSTFGALFDEWQDARSISPRTKAHEGHLLDRHLATLKGRRVQNIDARDLAKILRGMRDDYFRSSYAISAKVSGHTSLTLLLAQS